MEDFTGFRFGNWHTKDLDLYVVSSSDRYNKNLLPPNTDYTEEIPGGNGKYYFGNTFSERKFTVNVAYNNVSEEQFRLIQNMFATDKLEELVFDEEPYKTFKAKVESAPDFQFLCFTDRKTGQRVYKGEGTINFVCYHPFAYCYNKYLISAVDYYRITKPPYKFIRPSVNELRNRGPYKKLEIDKQIKEFYNVNSHPLGIDRERYDRHFDETDFNGDKFLTQWIPHGQQRNFNAWEGGYPTFEQVRKGELFFKAPEYNTYPEDYYNFSERTKTVNPIINREKYGFDSLQYETDSAFGNMTEEFDTDDARDKSLLLDNSFLQTDDKTAHQIKTKKHSSSNEHIIFDARQYVNNLEEWSHTSGLATTPTLNNHQELMYLPQISKHVYCNLDTGKINWTGVTGNTLLVYNPGDIPVDFDLKILANTKYFNYGDKDNVKSGGTNGRDWGYGWKAHGRAGTRFQIRRYNVQELSIPDAVDWCDMQTLDGDESGKYGPNYFDIDPSMYNDGAEFADDCTPIYYSTSHGKSNHTSDYTNGVIKIDDDGDRTPWYKTIADNDINKNGIYIPTELLNGDVQSIIDKRRQNFKEIHPKHCYIIEPIPKNQLGDYIRLFYWQTVSIAYEKSNYARNFSSITGDTPDLFEKGIWYADEYDKKYKRCRTERERNKLYWKTIDEAILKRYNAVIYRIYQFMVSNKTDYGINLIPIDLYKLYKQDIVNSTNETVTKIHWMYRSFKYAWIWNFPQYIYRDKYLHYKENEFNEWTFPSYYTDDYFEIDADTLVDDLMRNDENNTETEMIDKDRLFLSSEKEILYTNIDKHFSAPNNGENFYYPPKSKKGIWGQDEETYYNRFDYNPHKAILNDAILRGHWFKIPPGWSVIQILPVTDDWEYPERTWFDARQFYWGFGGRNDTTQDSKYIGTPQVIQSVFDFCYENAARYFFQNIFDGIGYLFENYDQITTDSKSDGDQLSEKIWNISSKDTTKVNKVLSSYFPYDEDALSVSNIQAIYNNDDIINFLNNFRRYGGLKLKRILNDQITGYSVHNTNDSFYYRDEDSSVGHKHSYNTLKEFYTYAKEYNKAREEKRLDETPEYNSDQYDGGAYKKYDYRFNFDTKILTLKLYFEWCNSWKNAIELRFLEIVQLLWNCVAPLNRNAVGTGNLSYYYIKDNTGISYKMTDLNPSKKDQNGDSFKNSYIYNKIYYEDIGETSTIDEYHQQPYTAPFKGEISEWWWYACNYLWANFPPPYWGYMDFINQIEIKYIPEYY